MALKSGDVGPGELAARRTLPSFIAPPPVLSRPAPGDKGTFGKLGSNLLFQAQPAVVHFGGYSLGKVHEQVVQVGRLLPGWVAPDPAYQRCFVCLVVVV